MSGLLSLATETSVDPVVWHGLWLVCSSGGGDPGPSAVSNIQKVLNEPVLSKWRPGPALEDLSVWKETSGQSARACETCGVTVAELLLLLGLNLLSAK